MKQSVLSMIILILGLSPVGATEVGVVRRGMAEDSWLIQRFHIKWGIETRTEQIWDGHAELSQGTVLSVDPFIRREILYDSMIVSDTSWRSTTHTDVEGIYITVLAPLEAVITIHTQTHDFTFGVDELEPGESREELSGDIQITNVTEEVLFRIAGLEHGVAG